MSDYCKGLDKPLHDPPVYRDTFAEVAMAERLRAAEQARDRELDEMIAMGWGATDGRDIPENWREVRGPETEGRRTRKQETMRRIRALARKA